MSKLCLKEKWYNIPGNSKIKVKENKILNLKKYRSSRTREEKVLSDGGNYEVIINESGEIILMIGLVTTPNLPRQKQENGEKINF